MNNIVIKSVIRKIYSINYNNIKLDQNDELIISRTTNDFHQLLFMNDDVTNIHLIPYFETESKSTQTGLFYRDNSFYNHPVYGDSLISFRLSLSGIRNDRYYRVRFIVSPTDKYGDNSTKLYTVLNGRDIMSNQEITQENTTIDHIFSSDASVMSIAVTIGKIHIHDIIIDEVEVMDRVSKKETIELPDLMNLKAYAVVKTSLLTNIDRDITKFPIIRGVGLNVLFDRVDDVIIVERNKENDVIQDNIGTPEYLTDIKVFNGGLITNKTISEDISKLSNTRGYVTFDLDETTPETVLYILVYQLL